MGDPVDFQRGDFSGGAGGGNVAGNGSTATTQLQDVLAIQCQQPMVYFGFRTADIDSFCGYFH